MLDLSNYKVVDDHCHPFLPTKESKPFPSYLKLSDVEISQQDVVNTFLYRQMMKELSRLLGVQGCDEEIIKEREKQYKQDPIEYIRLLFSDARIDMMLVDTGYPSIESTGYSISIEEFRKIVPCKVREIIRIERVLYSLMRARLSFNSAVDGFHKQIDEAVSNGAASLKTIIAYRTGLNIKRRSENEAEMAYAKLALAVSEKRSVREVLSAKTDLVKTVFDYFAYLGIEASRSYGIPFQIHTGFGDAPMDLSLSNPLLLHEFINDHSVKNVRIVLVHGGYPFTEESGFLVSSYPNVFLDLSEMIPFATIGAVEKLLNLFEMAPTNKIVYGSDGFNIPEFHWLASRRVKKSLSKVLDYLIEAEELDEEEAKKIAQHILFENAKKLYRLSN
ncbi:amidohydrolase family protein [Candidatus Bathyarchaeota archaeon]|nr:amidohydrolase family protein [Candidatus Bathyarchaeota archaeon]